MRHLIIVLCISTTLTSCGTTGGILNGTGTVLEGVATDLRSVSRMLNR
jgi:hypothetical protein